MAHLAPGPSRKVQGHPPRPCCQSHGVLGDISLAGIQHPSLPRHWQPRADTCWGAQGGREGWGCHKGLLFNGSPLRGQPSPDSGGILDAGLQHGLSLVLAAEGTGFGQGSRYLPVVILVGMWGSLLGSAEWGMLKQREGAEPTAWASS